MGSSASSLVHRTDGTHQGAFDGSYIGCYLALPLGVSAYNSGGIEASESQVAMIPSTGLNVGDSVTFYLTLTNTNKVKQIMSAMLYKISSSTKQIR